MAKSKKEYIRQRSTLVKECQAKMTLCGMFIIVPDCCPARDVIYEKF